MNVDGNLDLKKILNDDFLTYPKFLRKSKDINNAEDYFNYVEKFFHKDRVSTVKEEKSNMVDFYFRVYVKEIDSHKAVAYIIGVINKHDFVDGFNIKKMVKPNKSESAIYLSKKLNSGNSILSICNQDKFKIKKSFLETKLNNQNNNPIIKPQI